ncbi:MAG: translation initiation factor [Candidatus Marinimicrobia bacterium]|nr:translation initiation factor [Candidatus Neomarinimicrobiota bacterium]MDP6612124.1 translation initiation factor [Candidatus Neomarinimicrobiota bacterium]
MGKLNRSTGIVYSTDPNYTPEQENETVTQDRQDFRVHLDRRRGGKIVTIVRGFVGQQQVLSALGKTLKQQCGVGGTVKDNEILIQGNVRDKVISLLTQKGHIAKPSGG